MSDETKSVAFPPFDTLLVSEDGPVVTVTLNRPERRNALSPEMIAEFGRLFDLLDARDDLTVVVLKGSGPSFCTGYDMKAHFRGKGMGEAEEKRPQYQDLQWNRRTVALWSRLWDMSKVTIAQVHGHCVAGGLMLAMQCDLVYVAEDARIGQPIARRMAMTPDFAVWPLTIGLRRTKELLYTGDLVTGVEAARTGMVNRAVPAEDLDEYVAFMAHRIGLASAGMLQSHKYAVNEVADAMGYRQMLHASIHADTLQHYLEENFRFRGMVQDSTGVQEAIADRDRAYGGIVTTDEAWQRYRDGAPANLAAPS
jgi:enoyl-CoA hydratase